MGENGCLNLNITQYCAFPILSNMGNVDILTYPTKEGISAIQQGLLRNIWKLLSQEDHFLCRPNQTTGVNKKTDLTHQNILMVTSYQMQLPLKQSVVTPQ